MIKILMAKETFKTVDACRAKNDPSRESLQGLNITQKHIEATDGRMCLRVDRELVGIPQDAKPGVYKIIGTNKQSAGFIEIALEIMEGYQFPNVDLVIPEISKAADTIAISILPPKNEPVNLTTAIIKLFQHTGNGYSGHLLSKLAGLAESWSTTKASKDKPIRLDASGYTAVICPFKI